MFYSKEFSEIRCSDRVICVEGSKTDKNWFQTHLNGRQQFVCIDGAHSQAQAVKNGVPQRSVLGPLLFLLYINDIMVIELSGQHFLYADDIATLKKLIFWNK
jgi:hypothetical protein